jgi:hypothetical protein
VCVCVTLDAVRIGDRIYCTIIRLLTTSNYSVIVNRHTLPITRAQVKSSQSAFTSRSLVTDLNNGDSSASTFTSLLSGEYLTTERLLSWVELSFMLRPTVSRPVCLGIKHPFGAYDQIFINCMPITVFFLVERPL